MKNGQNIEVKKNYTRKKKIENIAETFTKASTVWRSQAINAYTVDN